MIDLDHAKSSQERGDPPTNQQTDAGGRSREPVRVLSVRQPWAWAIIAGTIPLSTKRPSLFLVVSMPGGGVRDSMRVDLLNSRGGSP